MQDETHKLQEDARRFWNKAVGYLKTVPGKVDDTVRRTAESSVLRMEIVGQRRELSQAHEELGRRVHDLVKLQGAVTAEEISLAVEKVSVIESRIAEKEHRIAELDLEAAAPQGPRPTRVKPSGSPPAKKAAKKKSVSRPKTTASRPKTAAKAAKKRPAAKKTISKKAPARKTAPNKAASKKRTVARKSPKP